MSGDALLRVSNLSVGYGGRPVLDRLTMELRRNEVLCLLGHNGAGKSTLLKAMFGLVPRQEGTITFDGQVIETPTPRKLTAAGVALVPEGRGVFPGLTVMEIMRLGFWAAEVAEAEQAARLEWVMDALPALRDFLHRPAGTLSGGQQQMVSIGRALLSRPKCLLCDEPSIGLAPKLFQDLLRPIRRLQQERGMSILIVEQNVRETLKMSDRVIVMKSGALIDEGRPDDFTSHAKLMELY